MERQMHAEFSDSSVVMMAAVVVLNLTYFPISLDATCALTTSRGARTRRHVFIVHVARLQPGRVFSQTSGGCYFHFCDAETKPAPLGSVNEWLFLALTLPFVCTALIHWICCNIRRMFKPDFLFYRLLLFFFKSWNENAEAGRPADRVPVSHRDEQELRGKRSRVHP